jgi:PAS domain S-box-containing protein
MSKIRNRRILLIDDTPAIHEDFRKILVQVCAEEELKELEESLFGREGAPQPPPGFELESAYQGEEGVAKLKGALESGSPFALAFVDMRIPPGWDGVETIERLWEVDPRLQVVLCTAYSDYSREEMLGRLEVADRLLVLKKPFDAIEVGQLASTLSGKWELARQAELKFAALEEAVRRRTAELGKANQTLQADIRERHRAEQQTRDAFHRISGILEFLPDATMVVDAEGKVIAWNRAIESMTGVKMEQILGKGEYAHSLPFYGVRKNILIDMLDEPDEVRERIYPGARREGKTLFAEAKVMLYGELRDLWSSATPLFNMQGEKIGGIQSLRDVTELRRAEQERSRLEAQLHHGSMIESLMAQLGHDLKTPLTPLFALLPLLRKKIEDPAALRMLDICQNSVSQILALSSKALELVRLSGEETRTEPSPVPLSSAVESCINGCGVLFLRRGVTCLNEVDPSAVVAAAADQLSMLLDNLLSNAARYARENGKVRVAAARERGMVVVSVADDGVGLKPGESGRIFEEFFKADTARHDLNTQGLGLAICKRIVQNHEGRIWAESAGPGKGTTVYFTLKSAND